MRDYWIQRAACEKQQNGEWFPPMSQENVWHWAHNKDEQNMWFTHSARVACGEQMNPPTCFTEETPPEGRRCVLCNKKFLGSLRRREMP